MSLYPSLSEEGLPREGKSPSAPLGPENQENETELGAEDDFFDGYRDLLSSTPLNQSFESDDETEIGIENEPSAPQVRSTEDLEPTRRITRSAVRAARESQASNSAASQQQVAAGSNNDNNERRVVASNRYYSGYPGLRSAFEPVFVDGKRKNRCRSCNKEISAHMSERLLTHATNCKQKSDEEKAVFKADLEKSQHTFRESSFYNILLAQVLIKNNIPLRVMDCPLMQRLLRQRPPRELPSREILSKKYIPLLSNKIDKTFNELLTQAPNYYLSIEFDIWTDANCRSLMAVVATSKGGRKYLVGCRDISTTGHSSENLRETLESVLENLDPIKINGIISDADASCVRARIDLTETTRYKHVIPHRCVAHLVNLMGQNLTESEAVGDLVTEAIKLSTFLNSDTVVAAHFSEMQIPKCVRHVKTRWYSTVDMIESLLRCRNEARIAVMKALEDKNAQKKRIEARKDALKTLNDRDYFWADIENLGKVFRPLANCIAVAESNNIYLGDAIKCLIIFAKKLLAADWENEFILATIDSFFRYFSVKKLTRLEYSIYLAAYFLDRRHKMDFVSERGTAMVFGALMRVGSKMDGITKQDLSSMLAPQFDDFVDQKGSFGRSASVEDDAYSWWMKQPNKGILKSIAIRIVSLRASSANTERLFSSMKLVQAPQRTRFTVDKMARIARVRIANNWFCDEDEEAIEEVAAVCAPSESQQTQSIPELRDEAARVFNESLDSFDSISEDLIAPPKRSQRKKTTKKRKIFDGIKSVLFSRVATKYPHHRVNMLTEDAREGYNEFFEFFDLEKEVDPPTQCTDPGDADVPDEEFIKEQEDLFIAKRLNKS